MTQRKSPDSTDAWPLVHACRQAGSQADRQVVKQANRQNVQAGMLQEDRKLVFSQRSKLVILIVD